MRRMLIAQILWASVMVALTLLVRSLYTGCVTPPLVAEYGSSNVICPDGSILAPLSGYEHSILLAWVLGSLFIFLVRASYRYMHRPRRTRKVKTRIGFR